MEIKTKHTLLILTILAWIMFVGVSIEAGGYLFNLFYFLFVKPQGPGFFWNHLDFLPLYNYDKGHFVVLTAQMSIAAVLRSIFFYIIILMLGNKNLSFANPFSPVVRKHILCMGWIAIGIGLFAHYGKNYAKWLAKKSIVLPSIEDMQLGGADVWIFMGVTLFVIAQVFKRGIELQAENDLTV